MLFIILLLTGCIGLFGYPATAILLVSLVVSVTLFSTGFHMVLHN